MPKPSRGVPVKHCGDPNCVACQEERPFDLPRHLIDAAAEGRLVIFAGAGISTEKRRVFPWSFLEEIRSEINAPRDLSFPETMTLFCQRPDGRATLLLRIRQRLQYVRSHPELHGQATTFHRTLATMWQINEIITTNWDDFFEDICGAAPFITDKDLAFWSHLGRKVLKLHGSVHSLGDMVVTAEDYEDCYRRLATGVLGSRLRTLLADRTVVFVGYSLTDPDLLRLFSLLTQQMGGLRPTYYVVAPDASTGTDRERLKDLRRIQTDGTHFLWALKQELSKSTHHLPDSRFARLSPALARVRDAHRRLFAQRPVSKYPETIYCASYQDGLRHSLERAINLAHTGQYSHACVVQRQFREYQRISRTHLRQRNYIDAAYAEGYANGLLLLLAESDLGTALPLYFVFGAKEQQTSLAGYRRFAKLASSLHKRAFKQAVSLARGMEGLEVHHPPFLDTFDDDHSD